MRDVFLTVVIAGLIPVALFEPFVGAALWTWISVMNPHRLTWGFAYDLPFAMVVAIVTMVSLALAPDKVRFPWTPATKTLIAFMLWMSVTLLFALHFNDSIEMWLRVTKTIVMTLVVVSVVRTEKQLRIFLWVFVLSVAFFGIKGGIFAILTAGEMRVYGPPNSHIEDNNAISVALVMMIPLLWFMYQHNHGRLVRFGVLAALALSTVSVLASYSRGAFVAGCAMVFFLAVKARRRMLLLFLLVLGLPLMLAAMPEKWWDRMATINLSQPDQSVQGRFNAWQMAWNLALDRPIVGGGFAVYERDVFAKYAPNPIDIHSAHSIYFQMLGEHGFVGLGLFLLLAWLMWRTGSRVIAASTTPATHWRENLARALQVSMIGFLVGGLTVNIGYWDVFYFELVALVSLEMLCLQGSAPATVPATGLHAGAPGTPAPDVRSIT
jgi:probable O-glycosylation ligase (exosortase A-associated)